jgi:hypothetical protein
LFIGFIRAALARQRRAPAAASDAVAELVASI